MKNISILIIACFLFIQGYSQCGTAPTSITAAPAVSNLTGCRFTLTAVGGVLPAGGNYFWYMNSCGGTVIATGITTPIITLSNPADYYVRIEAPCGNTVCVSITVTASSLDPPAMITANGPTTFCIPGSVLLSANTGPGLKYQWRGTAMNTIPGATNSTFLVTQAIYGTITCEISYSPCWTSTSNSIYVQSVTPPQSGIWYPDPTTFCQGEAHYLGLNAPPYYTDVIWQRNGVDMYGTQGITQLQLFQSGTYTVTTSNFCGSAVSDPITINILPPGVGISASSTNFCPGITTTTLTATGGTGDSWQWRLSQSNISGATNSTYVPTVAGSYDCVRTNNCGTYTSGSLNITSNLPPTTISPTGTVDLCTSSVTLYAGTGSGLSWQWLRNGQNISGATNSSYNVTVAGDYYCLVSNNCTTVSTPITTAVGTNYSYLLTRSGDAGYCAGTGPVTFTANTGALTYQWKLNNVNIPGATNSTYTTNSPGTYTVVETNSCGTANLSNTLPPAGPPIASISSNGTTMCAGQNKGLQASTASGNTYQWRLNGNNISGAFSSSYSTPNPGSYDCIVTNFCGSAISNTITLVTVTPISATITANGPTSFCPGGSVTLSANTGPGITYQWLDNGSNIPGATNSTYYTATSINISCIVTNACDHSTSTTIHVWVYPLPTPPVISPQGTTSFCSGGNVQLNSTSNPGFSQWRLNSVPISGATNNIYFAYAAGNYDCTTSNACGTSASNSITVTQITPVPASITAGGSTSFCQGGSVLLSANTGAGLTYQWRNLGTNISGATASTYSATQAGNYDCVVSSLNFGCPISYSNTILVSVASASSASITANGPLTYCSTSLTTLTANNGAGYTYVWKKNGVAISGATAATYKPTSTGSYTVTVTNSCGTTTSAPVSITVLTAPSTPGTITGPGNFCSGQAGVVYSIAAVTGATSYTWQVPNGASITAGQGTTSITVTFGNKNGSIKVQAVNSCGSSNWQSKNVNKNCREGSFEIENAFDINVFPNPGSIFNLEVKDVDQPYSYELSDLTGVLIEKRDNLQPNTTIQLGEKLANGIYLIQIICGDERRVLKLVKQ